MGMKGQKEFMSSPINSMTALLMLGKAETYPVAFVNMNVMDVSLQGLVQGNQFQVEGQLARSKSIGEFGR